MSKVTQVSISGKGSDMFNVTFINEDDTDVEGDGYAPYIKGVCRGDYFNITIDNATGKIVGWVPIESEQVSILLGQM